MRLLALEGGYLILPRSPIFGLTQRSELREQFMKHGRELREIVWPKTPMTIEYLIARVAHSTARHRADAFLKAIGEQP